VPDINAIDGKTSRRTRPRRALRSDLINPTIAVHHGRVIKRTDDDKDSGASPG
jgi:hypothetical protein